MGDTAAEAAPKPAVKLGMWTLTAMVVGSMVGAGVFSLPRRFGEETGVYGALIAWAIGQPPPLNALAWRERRSGSLPRRNIVVIFYAPP